MEYFKPLITLLILPFMVFCYEYPDEILKAVEDGGEIVSSKTTNDGTILKVKIREGQKIKGFKYDLKARKMITDNVLNVKVKKEILSETLKDKFSKIDNNTELDVELLLQSPLKNENLKTTNIRVVRDGESFRYFLDGHEEKEDKIIFMKEQRKAIIKDHYNKAFKDLSKLVHKLNEKEQLNLPLAENGGPMQIIKKRLSKHQILNLIEKYPDIISKVDIKKEPQAHLSLAMTSAGLPNNNLYPYWHYYFWGYGSKLMLKEWHGHCPDADDVALDLFRYTRLPSKPPIYHNRAVAYIMQKVSPYSHVFCGDELDAMNYDIDVINLSYGGDFGGTYSQTFDGYWDNFIYNNRITVVASSGNAGFPKSHNPEKFNSWYAQEPSTAANVIGVGAYHPNNPYSNSNEPSPVWDSSAYINSEVGNEKPEIVAPGGDVMSLPGLNKFYMTSAAAPIVTGIIGNSLQWYHWLKDEPALIKAMLMASATTKVVGQINLEDPYNSHASDARAGAGAVNFNKIYFNANMWNSWDGLNSDFFYNEYIHASEYLIAGQRYRLVLAWLSNGNYIDINKQLNMDLDMEVWAPNGRYVGGSYSWDNPYEIVEFTAPYTGYYNIRINRWRNSGFRVIMGYSIIRVN